MLPKILRLPSITGIARRKIVVHYLEGIVDEASTPLQVLDIGAGINNWKSHFPAGKLKAYETVELKPDLNPTYTGDFLQMAFPSSYDLIIATELIEHLSRPMDFFDKASTILNPGGRLLVSFPFMFKIHGDPDDFFRYTGQGLRALASESFGIEHLHPHGGKVETLWEILSDGKLMYPLRLLNPLLASTKATASPYPLGYVAILKSKA